MIINWQNREWPVALAADFLSSREDSSISRDGFTEQHARTSEVDLGVRKIWRSGIVRPYLGGGVALASGEIDRTGPFGSISDQESGAGLWLGGGIAWTLSRAFNVGLDAKLSGARIRLLGDDVNAGGFHLGLLLGYHWGD